MMNLFSMWRSTRVLDGRKVGRAERSQSVVHALLSARDQVPLEKPPVDLRQRIAHTLEDTRPFTPSAADAWLQGSWRVGALGVALLTMSGLVIWQTNRLGTTPPTSSEIAQAPDDDPDPDLISDGQSGIVIAERESPNASGARPANDLAIMARSPESLQAQKDIEQLASTFMQAFPVRQDEPR